MDCLASGSAGAGFSKATDGGDHWTEISHNQGFRPSGLLSAVDGTYGFSPVKPAEQIWALVEIQPGGAVCSLGRSRRDVVILERLARPAAWRAVLLEHLRQDPKDTNVLAAPQVGAEWSKDGGMTWERWDRRGRQSRSRWASVDSKRDRGHMTMARVIADRWRHRHAWTCRPRRPASSIMCTSRTTSRIMCARSNGCRCRSQLKGTGATQCRWRRTRGRGGGGGGRGGPAATVYFEVYGVAGGGAGTSASNPVRPRHHLRRQLQRRTAGHRHRMTGPTERLDPWPLNPMGHDARIDLPIGSSGLIRS